MKHVDHILNERQILKYLTDGPKGSNAEIEKNHQNCPFIIKYFDSFQDDENLYYELEYVKGCSLLS